MTNTLTLIMLLAQFSLPRLPDIPHLPGAPQLPSQIPIPPLTQAPPDSIVVQPKQTLRQVPELDDFEPGRFDSLVDLPHDADGTVTLAPGAFELIDQSFCLRAGGHAPSSSSAYRIGVLSGSRASYVRSVLAHWRGQPAIPQADVQVLLWAITSQAKLSALPDHLQGVARALLTPAEIDQLNGGALGSIRDFLNRSGATLPAPVRQVLDTESQMRDLLTHGNASYQQIAALAVPPGTPTSDAGRARWSYDPRGYFVRYLPQSYSTTTIQVYVPPTYTVLRDPTGRVTRIADDRGSQLDVGYPTATTASMVLTRTTLLDGSQITSHATLGTSTLQRPPSTFADANLQTLDALARTAQSLLDARRPSLGSGLDAVTFVRGVVPAALCRTYGGCIGTRVAAITIAALGPAGPSVDPLAAMGTPADGAKQPLGQSGQPTASDKNKDCARVRDERAFWAAYRDEYRDPALVDAAKRGDSSGQQFQDAVRDKAQADGLGGSGSFHEGGYTDFEKCEAHFPTPQEVQDNGWPPIYYDAIKNHEKSHEARCLEARKTGQIDDWRWRQETEIEGYDRAIATLDAWLAANCR